MKTAAEKAGTSIYIVDKDYHIIYFNDVLLKEYPGLKKGDICYDVLCAENSPCSHCPMQNSGNDTSIFYNNKKHLLLEVNTAAVSWPDAGDCTLILCKQIHESNKNLFYNLTNSSTYDELFELNLTKDYYKILYCVADKYVTPADEGPLSDMIFDIARQMIHPDDRDAFLKFWNLERLMNTILTSDHPSPCSCQFRQKRLDGSYGWIIQTAVPLSHNDTSDQIVMCFVQDIQDQKTRSMEQTDLFARNSGTAVTQDYYFNKLTGLYRRSFFFDAAEAFLKCHPGIPYCLMAIDIEHFKLFNEWYGTRAGDKFLINIGSRLKKVQDESNGIAGYIGGDNFAIILPDDPALLKKLQDEIMGYVRQYGDNAGFIPAFGLYNITDMSIPVSTMYDRALLAQESIKGNYATRVCRYDTDMMHKIEEEHVLLTEVQRALQNGEFTFYAQPKCHMATGKIIGLESLIRWNHPLKGVIAPNDFVPVLEQNGLITDLDLYVWDMVCRSLKHWIDAGHRAVPISVNVSRVDIYSLDVVDTFQKLTGKYGLNPGLVEIEITESAYAENAGIVKEVVENLRKSGFTVLMDDFGSGYSSLNMLKDVNVDVLKIDMEFLDMSDETAGKGMGILEAITSMARLIDLKLIAEGVETKKQVDFLMEMGCHYAQGYYFYPPMPVEVFETILADERNIDFRGINARQLDRLHIRELLDDNLFSETMLNNILGGIAFYDLCGRRLKLLRANEHYYKVTGTNPIDLASVDSLLPDGIVKEDLHLVTDIFSRARQDVMHGAEGSFRKIRGDKKVIWMHLRAFFLREQDGHSLYYGSVSDISEQKKSEQQIWILNRKMEKILNQAGINIWDWDVVHNTITLSSNIFSEISNCSMPLQNNKPQIFENFPDCFLTNPYFPEGYRDIFTEYLRRLLSGDAEEPVTLEMPIRLNGKLSLWIKAAGSPIRNEKEEVVNIIGYFVDITHQKKESLRRQQLKKLAETDPLTGLFNRFAAINKIKDYLAGEKEESAALIMMDLDNFKLANDVFGHAYGDSLISQTAMKICGYFRSDDILCRIGGDEFLVLCKNIHQKDVEKKLLHVIDALRLSLKRDGFEIQFSISIGYAMIPEQGKDFDTLYQCADIALFSAKTNGKQSFTKYDPSMKAIRYELVKENPEP